MILSAKRQALFPFVLLSSASTPAFFEVIAVKPTAVTRLYLTNQQQSASTEYTERAMYSSEMVKVHVLIYAVAQIQLFFNI